MSRLEHRFGYLRIPSPRLRILELIHGGSLGELDLKVARAVIAHLRQLLRRAEVDAIRLHYADVASPLLPSSRAFAGFRSIVDPCQRSLTDCVI